MRQGGNVFTDFEQDVPAVVEPRSTVVGEREYGKSGKKQVSAGGLHF